MRVLSFFAMLLAIAFIVGMDVLLFSADVSYGIGGIIGIIGYFIAYAISVDMTLSPSDFWFQSSWEIFKKKMGYALGTYILTTLVAAGVIATI